VVPIKATQPAAVGPPRLIAATKVAIEVLMRDPLGICTGNADARSVSTVQKAIPAQMSIWEFSNHPREIRGSTGITRLVTVSANALTATSPVM
jgi:hypothetical protein